MFDPFTGPWDTAIHFILPAAMLFYFTACIWCCFQLVKWSGATRLFREGQHASIALLVLIAGQLAFTLLTPARSGSSYYHPLFPDFLAGIILALSTLVVGREYLGSRFGFAIVAVAVFFWLAGSTTVDLLWWTERTNRGVGPVWHLPLISSLLAAVSYIFIFGGESVEVCLYFPSATFKAGSVIQFVWFFALISLAAWYLRPLTPNRPWPASIAMTASVAFLAYKAIEWSSFIAD